MKKSLFALAAVGAFAGAAQAQSSVTVYGILDVGFGGTNSRGPTTTAPSPSGAQGNTQKSTTAAFNSSRETSSRLGFRGTEDLGGGTSAFFTFELGVDPQATTWSPNNRQTFVGVRQKGIGQASIGTQYTALWLNALNPTDPGQGNNVAGNVIRPIGNNAAQDAAGAASTAVTILTTNSLYLQSERMAGFRLGANYVQNGADATQRAAGAGSYSTTSGGTNNFNGYSISVDYTWNKLYAAAAWSSFKQEQNATGTFSSWANAFPSTPITLGTTTNTNDNQWYVGAVYDFGILKAYANYVNRKIENGLNANQFLSRTAQQIGVRGNITKTIEGWASAGNGRLRQFGASEPTANFNAWQLGSNYWLSKRTNLYAIYGQSVTSGVSGSSVVGANGGAAFSQYAVGVRHTF